MRRLRAIARPRRVIAKEFPPNTETRLAALNECSKVSEGSFISCKTRYQKSYYYECVSGTPQFKCVTFAATYFNHYTRLAIQCQEN